MSTHIFICVHCKRLAKEEDIVEVAIGPRDRKKVFITVICPACKVHTHYLKKV